MSGFHAGTLGSACREIHDEALEAVRNHEDGYLEAVSDAIKQLSAMVRGANACANALENMHSSRPDFDEAEHIREFVPKMDEAMRAEMECWEWLDEGE